MRNLRCCLSIAALSLVALGCQREQQQPVQHPEVVPVPQPPEEALPPESAEAVPHAETRPPPVEQEPSRPQGPRAMQTTHDLVIDALVCGLPPGSVATLVGPRGGGPTMSPEGASSMQDRCNALAPNVSAEDFSTLDTLSVQAVRDAIERRAAEGRLDDSARMQMLALYDRGIEAEREALRSLEVGDKYAVDVAVEPSPSSRQPRGPAIDPTDLGILSARDRLSDLLLFSRASESGALATEAEALAWVLATERFLQTEALPTRLRVYAAEPLFESLLSVPTPQQADSLDPSRITQAVWSQYLETAVKAAEMMPQLPSTSGSRMQNRVGSQAGKAQVVGEPQSQKPPSSGDASSPRAASSDQKNMQKIVVIIGQRMEALSRRMPASDLRLTLDSFANELRAQPSGIGGGPPRR